jgi:glycolate oxidase
MADVDELARVISPDSRLITDPAVTDAYSRDQAHLVQPGSPLGVLLAASTADVSRALAWANRSGVPVVARGAGTGLSGGAAAIDGCLVVSTARMTRIHEVSLDDQLAVVEAGVVTKDVDRAAAEVGLMYAPDPSSVDICTIGGNLATNAGGLRCVKYGVTRDAALALEVVLADGRVINTGHRTVKGVTGYDLTGLFVGSEGTLGIITGATLRLHPRPAQEPITIVGSFPTLRAAAEAVAAIVRSGARPALMELMDRATVRAINDWKQMGLDDEAAALLVAQSEGADADSCADTIAIAFEKAGAEFVARSSDPAEAKQLLDIRRLAYPACERLGSCLVEDVGVPRSRLPELLEAIEDVATRHGVTIMTVAHAGDGNVHPTFVFEATPDGDAPAEVWAAADEIFRTALALGGTLTGEHGVGVLKQHWLGLELGEDSLAVQHAIKTALDPRHILNPGRGI